MVATKSVTSLKQICLCRCNGIWSVARHGKSLLKKRGNKVHGEVLVKVANVEHERPPTLSQTLSQNRRNRI